MTSDCNYPPSLTSTTIRTAESGQALTKLLLLALAACLRTPSLTAACNSAIVAHEVLRALALVIFTFATVVTHQIFPT